MKKIRLELIMLVGLVLTGCGGGDNQGGKSTFTDSNNSPTVGSVSEINNTVEPERNQDQESESNTTSERNNTVPLPSLYSVEQNETDIVAYIRENTQEAFKVNGIDKSNILYFLSEDDFKLCDIDPLNGEIFFRKPTDYETKSLYRFNVVLQDSVGHRTIKRVTIYIVDTKNEHIVKVIDSNTSLVNDELYYFITRWNVTDENENKLRIPTLGDGYNYSVDWGDGRSSKQVTTSIIHKYASSDTYTVKILGDFPRFRVHDIDVIIDENGKSVLKYNNDTLNGTLKSIEQWGNIKWKSMRFSFDGILNATDKPDLSKVKDMTGMFLSLCTSATDEGCAYIDLNHWDVSNIKNMSWMFRNADFEPNISEWNVSNVIDMSNMFRSAGTWRYAGGAVITDISKWNVSNVRNMSKMFFLNDSFDRDITKWNVSNVTDMSYMFAGKTRSRMTSFNQDISKWDVSQVRDMSFMFLKNSNFNQDLENWNVRKDTNRTCMFEEAPSLEKIPSWYN